MEIPSPMSYYSSMSKPDELLLTEAAKLIGISHATLSAHVAAGRIPYRTLGRYKLIRRADAIKFRDTPRKAGRPRKKG